VTTIQVCECPDQFLVAAQASKINNGAYVTGSVIVNGPARSTFKFGQDVFMEDGTSVSADTLKIGTGSSVYDVFTNNLRPSLDATIRGSVQPLTLPVLSEFCSVPDFACGTEDVIVPDGVTLLGLAPGAYGRLILANGATLQLNELAEYTFCSIKINSYAQVVSPQQVTINVTGKFQMKSGSFVGTTTGAPLILNSSGSLIRISQSAVLNAAITAPYAKFKIQRRGTLLGCMCINRFSTDKETNLLCKE